jgi:hypothetical protein
MTYLNQLSRLSSNVTADWPGQISNACMTDVKQSCPGKERTCILKNIGNLKDQCKDALGQAGNGGEKIASSNARPPTKATRHKAH